MPLDPQVQILLKLRASFGTPALTSGSVAEVRQYLLEMQKLAGKPEPVAKVEDRKLPESAGNLAVRIYTPQGSGPFPILVYFHGGGFICGDLNSFDSQCRALTNRVGCLVVSVDYRLAPEHPFPAAVEDAYAAIEWVADHAEEIGGDATRLAVGGDSAGGNLAAVVSLMARDRGKPALIYQVLIYPVTDATMSSASYEENGEGYGLTTAMSRWFNNQYLPSDVDRKNPYISPLWAPDLKNLPPTLVITAEFDPLRDEGEMYAARLKEAGVKVESSRYDGMIHGFFQMTGALNGGKKAIEQIAAALRAAFAT
jgi:acetyl esterase